MHFDLVDRVLERHPDRIVTLKAVTRAEEYLQDHFATFPVLPGVFMLESMVQAARALLADRPELADHPPLVLGGVRALKYGRFVRPGEALRVEVELQKGDPDAGYALRGRALLVSIDTAVHAGASTGADTGPNTGLDTGAEAGPAAADLPVAASGRLLLRPARLELPTTAAS